jgi:hypothetical protein
MAATQLLRLFCFAAYLYCPKPVNPKWVSTERLPPLRQCLPFKTRLGPSQATWAQGHGAWGMEHGLGLEARGSEADVTYFGEPLKASGRRRLVAKPIGPRSQAGRALGWAAVEVGPSSQCRGPKLGLWSVLAPAFDKAQ